MFRQLHFTHVLIYGLEKYTRKFLSSTREMRIRSLTLLNRWPYKGGHPRNVSLFKGIVSEGFSFCKARFFIAGEED